VCRKCGLETTRRCGWLGYTDEPKGAPVWARKNVTLHTCPKSFVTSESQALVEEFLVRRRLGAIDIRELSAKQVEAFALLEQALTAEVRDGQQNRRAVT
jgi:hypothetical protein